MTSDPVHRSYAQPVQLSDDALEQVLSLCPLTFSLPPYERSEIAADLSAWSWQEGEPLLLTGVSAAGCYIIVSGRVRLTRITPSPTSSGRETTVNVLGPGEIVGPVPPDEQAAGSSAWALTETTALLLPGERLQEAVDTRPSVAAAVKRIRDDRIASARSRERARLALSVEQRVGAVLRGLDAKFGRTLADGSRLLEAGLLREDVADMAGTSEDAAAAALERMARARIVDSGLGWSRIIDAEALADLVREG